MSSLYKNVVVWDASRQSAEISDVVINGSVIESILPAGTAASGIRYSSQLSILRCYFSGVRFYTLLLYHTTASLGSHIPSGALFPLCRLLFLKTEQR